MADSVQLWQSDLRVPWRVQWDPLLTWLSGDLIDGLAADAIPVAG